MVRLGEGNLNTMPPDELAMLIDRLQTAGMQRRAEGDVVDLRQLVVDALDEVVLDGSNRERSRPRVRTRSSASTSGRR